ncbi:DgyrCDS5799 [Dimorphilus gyrociliatus]|uniref:DgyrCDS5799 n=1 Tax=Dimorphilus gyrociliatus TaxID=2664684 RepID=A0A7I8VKZ0_9ANNE|nr:DgyrCDS5799 [Dimorphilus gyrociliatus]
MDITESDTKDDCDLDEFGECYCGKERKIGSVEYQCNQCLQFCHQECINCYIPNRDKNVPFTTNYTFTCKRCTPQNIENFSRKQIGFTQMCQSAIANLMIMNPGKQIFSLSKEIIPFIDENWESLTTMARRVKQTWHTTVSKTMLTKLDIFVYNDENPLDYHYGLICTDLSKICPNYEQNKDKISPAVTFDGKSGRGVKRKAAEAASMNYRAKKGEVTSINKLIPHCFPTDHPFNKDGYRYILAEPDMHAPNRTTYDQSTDWAGKPIPGYLYRAYLEENVFLALHDRAPQLKLSETRFTVTGEKGYSTIRATHGVNRGTWYFEVTVDEMPEKSACRLGWSQHLAILQSPCGYEKFGYSWRSRKGTIFHDARGKHYSSGYKEGDVLGFLIHLPSPKKLLPYVYKDKPLVKFKNHLYFEERDEVNKALSELTVSHGSKLVMYKNGECQGVAKTDIYEGTYYPAISLYRNCTVNVNFGPKFHFPPKDEVDYRSMSEAAAQTMVDHALGDLVHHVANEES